MRPVALLLLALPVFAQSLPEPSDARGWLNRGVQLYKSAKYEEAAQSFQKAVEMNSNDPIPRLYLASVYMARYIPGGDSVENTHMARNAEREFRNVLQIAPRNLVALQSLAALSFQQTQGNRNESEKLHHLNEAERWNQEVIEVDPNNKEALYSLGVIAWSKAYPAIHQARAQLGMRPEEPGPLRDNQVRLDLRSRFGQVIEDGMRNLKRALEVDTQYDDAIAYLSLLQRLRADLADDPAQYYSNIAVADTWVQAALEIKKRKAATGIAGTGSTAQPPPPPPQPALTPDKAPPYIRVGGNVQANKLIHQVPPIYPAEALRARIQGVVRFQARISEAGDVVELLLVSGHPMLVKAAQEAVTQWRYQPTLLNGQPVAVITQVDVNFTLGP